MRLSPLVLLMAMLNVSRLFSSLRTRSSPRSMSMSMLGSTRSSNRLSSFCSLSGFSHLSGGGGGAGRQVRSSREHMYSYSRSPPARQVMKSNIRSLMMTSEGSSTLASIKLPTAKSQYVFVGGKGGVGKTTSSSAIALSLSDAGQKTLLVSTDPAHSLGDALGIDLSSGKLVRVDTETNLWALEIDVEASLNEFKEVMKGVNSASLAASLGVPKDILDSLGLDDLTDLFTNPPPGIDEIVALSKVFQYADKIMISKVFPEF